MMQSPYLWLTKSNCLGLVAFYLLSGLNAHGMELKEIVKLECTYVEQTSQAQCVHFNPIQRQARTTQLKVNGRDHEFVESTLQWNQKAEPTAILFLIDISDPNRNRTIQEIREHIKLIARNKNDHHSLAIATFSNEYLTPLPFGTDNVSELEKSLDTLKAKGHSTELYRNTLLALDYLNDQKHPRKGLIIISDGKAEDRAYTSDEVIKAANRANIRIMSLGYAERESESPFLQNLRKLADRTGGAYFQVKSGASSSLPILLTQSPFLFAESLRAISFPTESLYGTTSIELLLTFSPSEQLILTSSIELPDRRSFREKAQQLYSNHSIKLAGSALLLLLVAFSTSRFYYKYKQRSASEKPIAWLKELGGAGVRYPIKKGAVRLGRSPDNEICLRNDSISGYHAEIHRSRKGSFYIVDLASTNGVYVNNSKVIQAELRNDDMIEIGEMRFRFIS